MTGPGEPTDIGFPLPGTAGELAALFRERVGAAWSEIAATLQPGVRLQTRPVPEGGLPLGATKYGGDPDLPVGDGWPQWTTPDGETRNLRFFAQLDLASVSAAAPEALGLPNTGLLSFFADFGDWDDEGISGLSSWEQPGATVRFAPTGSALERLPSPLAALPEAALVALGTWTWRFEGIELDDDQFDALDALDNAYNKAILGVTAPGYVHGGRHQFGGLETYIQHPAAEEVVQALAGCYDQVGFDHEAWHRAEHQVADWRLLLQIDSDDAVDAMWGDVGTIYWMARHADIAAGQWDQGMFNFQCS